MENTTEMDTHSGMEVVTDNVNLQNYSNMSFTGNKGEESEDVTKLAMSFTMYKIGKWVVICPNQVFHDNEI